MVILLDTNALVWLLTSPNGGRFGAKAKAAIDRADEIYTSSVNILELRIKQMLGKIEVPDNLLELIDESGLSNLPFHSKHADGLLCFPTLSKHDPFDRMLLAQAQLEGMQLLTNDKFLLDLGLDNIIDANK